MQKDHQDAASVTARNKIGQATYNGMSPYIQSISVKLKMPVFGCIIEAVDSGMCTTQPTRILALQFLDNGLQLIVYGLLHMRITILVLRIRTVFLRDSLFYFSRGYFRICSP